ncbi:hypothetical protein J3Q64DRAFT_1863673 [Phycomyces blakesleeanus]|uniref:Zn(2)-C6 fungal-type domain-containing protein n=1 Tax=Phycomyces blakesleeanus TaxID=4837 RepID=A0ABR3AX24_PHYBL
MSPQTELIKPKDQKDLLHSTQPGPRQKRFKVGRACYTCRVKKIKCDGVHPCMQCKARRRPCSFSKDGTEQDDHDSDFSPPENSPNLKTHTPTSTPSSPSKDSTLLPISTSKRIASILEIVEQNNNSLVDKWRLSKTFEKDINRPPPPHYQGSVPVVSRAMQQQLLHLYFKHCYAVMPFVPKRTFFDLLESKASFVTPLLLGAMFAHAAQHLDEERVSRSNTFFKQTKSLVDDFLDAPRLSTVVALLRMSADLGLMKRSYAETYHNQPQKRQQLQQTSENEKELRKRVCWGCYCLDKLQNICTGQPWMMRAKDIELEMPLLQPGDDVEEHRVLEGFVAYIRLMRIAERVLQPDLPSQTVRAIVRTQEHEQLVVNFDNELLSWLQSLSPQLQWTPLPSHALPSHAALFPTEAPPNSMVGHLHLVYNLVELSLLRPDEYSLAKTAHQRCTVVAGSLTQLTSLLAAQHNLLFSFSLACNATILATKVHLRNCSDTRPEISRRATRLFKRSLQSLLTLSRYWVDTNMDHFIDSLDSSLIVQEHISTPKDMTGITWTSEQTPSPPPHSHPSAATTTATVTATTSNTSNNNANTSSTTRQKLSPALEDCVYIHDAEINAAQVLSCTFHPPHWRAPASVSISASDSAPGLPTTNLTTAPSSNPLDFLTVDDDSWVKSVDMAASSSAAAASVGADDYLFKARSLFDRTGTDARTPGELLMATSANNNHLVDFVTHMDKGINKARRAGGMMRSSWHNHNTHNDPMMYSLWPETTIDSSTDTSNQQQNQQLHQHQHQHQHQNQNNHHHHHQHQQNQQNQNQNQNQNQQQQQQQQQQNQHHAQQSHQQQAPPVFHYQPSYMNIGLGVYASAHQHRDDVIRQHFSVDTSTPMVRPVVLTHQGQVVVSNVVGDTSHP